MVDRIAQAPKSLPVVLRIDGTEVHRALLDRFPYAIVFLSPRQGEVRVLAVAHLHRRPDY
jgi:hypothetical protein